MYNGFTSPLGDGVTVTQTPNGNRLALTVALAANTECVLHWGLSRRADGPWIRPPDSSWPEGSTPGPGEAVRTPFAAAKPGERNVTIQLPLPCPANRLAFVVHLPRENRWIKSGGKDFFVPLRKSASAVTPDEALRRWVPEEGFRKVFALDGNEQLAVVRWRTPEGLRVGLACSAEGPLQLHWGLAWQFQHEWQQPPERFRPAGTVPFDPKAVRTPFRDREGLQYLELNFPCSGEADGPRGLWFLPCQPEENVWFKSSGKDLYLPLFEQAPDARLPSRLGDLAEQVVGAERGASSWTLMHRFHLCHDLLESAQNEEALALLFAWLRYSQIRQLDWQRRYNTKPRELSAAQDRLTRRLAGIWRNPAPRGTACRPWLRLLLTTLGRGGEGQQVRDEILHIMHRHHIKEVSGHFLEEWHQKLHNNTTPDDIVICSAYLACLRSNGDLSRYWKTLEEGGVSRERLQSFERPIKSDPTFEAELKEALIKDFENFLRILKSVHAGTDLESAAAAAKGSLEEGTRKKIEALVASLAKPGSWKDRLPALVSAREELQKGLAKTKDDGALRDLLFLDLALEESLRGLIERQNLSQFDRDQLVDLIGLALRNLNLSIESQELAVCLGHWTALMSRPRTGRDWALHAKSVADRLARWVRGFSDDLYQRLQPKAEFLGEALEVEKWTIPLFSEEVIRGGPAFVLSLLLRPLDRLLRQAAGLGGWQVISPAPASGRVRLVDKLIKVQGERFPEATVLVADAVSGNEEIPEGVTAVLTSDSPDLVSHVAVRARNAHVLFATCCEPSLYERLKGLKDRSISLRVTPGGDVEYQEGAAAQRTRDSVPTAKSSPLHYQPPDSWVITQDQFAPDRVGGKSNNLNGLRGRLLDWIHLPTSLALPFGSWEKALAEGNPEQRREYEKLVATVEQNPAEVLPRLRALVEQMAPPAGLQQALTDTWGRAGLPQVPWEQTWSAIRRVWASRWNDRAFHSRRAQGIPHEQLTMAVLIQQVVPADYAFVIHTCNPLTGNTGELFAEVVLGLGETLVGNYPGRALGFVCRKADLNLELISYPSKSVGLYGKGVIFRSDSNGEDLEQFAGAGLYDSVLAEEPEQRLLDYRNEKLVWDARFRDELLRGITRAGL